MALQYTFAVPTNMLINVKDDKQGHYIIIGWRQYRVTKGGKHGSWLAAYTAKDVKDAIAAKRELDAKGLKSYERQV